MKKIICFFVVIFIYSCESEPANNADEESQNSAEVDQVLVENGIQTLMNCLEFLETGDFSNLLIDVYDDADADATDFHDTMLNAVEDIPNYQPLIDSDYPNEPFNLQSYFGTYTYNSQLQSWTTASSNSMTKMVFPLFTHSNSPDTTITISNASEQLMDIEDPIYIPVSLSVDMSYNAQTMFALNIDNVNYTMYGEIPVPDDVNFNIYMNPFTHDFSIDKISDDLFSVGYDLSSSDDGCVTQLQASIKLLNTDYENLEDSDIDFINGEFTTNSLKVEFNIDAEYLFAIDDPSNLQINNLVDVMVYEDGALLGEIELQDEVDDESSVHMVFVDGTSVNIESFSGIGSDAEEFVQTLEGIFSRYIDRLDDE